MEYKTLEVVRTEKVYIARKAAETQAKVDKALKDEPEWANTLIPQEVVNALGN